MGLGLLQSAEGFGEISGQWCFGNWNEFSNNGKRPAGS